MTAKSKSTSPNAYVATDGLNLRDKPEGAVIRELTLAQPVEDLGPAAVDGWRNVRVDGTKGAVFGKYLRPPEFPEVEALVAFAVAEWVRFDKGLGRESTAPYYRYVGEMWASIGSALDGRDTGVPWSAAFISFVVRKAGPAYAKFHFAASHSVFAHDAIQGRIMNRVDRPFWGYRQSQVKPALGDIVHRNRGSNSFSFDYAESHAYFESHSDIVVQVNEHMVRVLGGNVGDTVSLNRTSGGDDLQEYRLDADGFIAPGQNVICVLKNRAAQI